MLISPLHSEKVSWAAELVACGRPRALAIDHSVSIHAKTPLSSVSPPKGKIGNSGTRSLTSYLSF